MINWLIDRLIIRLIGWLIEWLEFIIEYLENILDLKWLDIGKIFLICNNNIDSSNSNEIILLK